MDALSSKRRRIMGLALAGFAPCLVLLGLTVKNAYDVRVDQAKTQNLFAARVSALLLDEQCKEAYNMLRTEANRFRLTAQGGPRLSSSLEQIVGDDTEWKYAAVCRRDGQVVSEYPEALASQIAGFRGKILSELRASKTWHSFGLCRVSIRQDKVDLLGIAIPLGGLKGPGGYAVAYRITTNVQNRLRIQEAGARLRIAILNSGRHVLDDSGNKNKATPFPDARTVLQAAKLRKEDSLLAPTDGIEPDIVGYATAKVPNWVVLVSQPLSAIQAANAFLFPGLVVFVLICAVVLFMAAEKFARLYGRLESMQLTLVDQNRNLRVLEKSKSEFLANVSHDLWTPMSSLEISLTGLLNPNIQWNPEQLHESLQLAHFELNHLQNRVRNLLAMARLDAHAELEEEAPCDLVDIAGSALERLAPMLKDRPVHAELPPYPLMFMGRNTQMEIVIINLLDNALKYSPPGSPFFLKADQRDNYVYFMLRDCGPGVRPEDKERIFEKFYRAQKAHAMGGIGLGLAISKAVVESHGGIIGVNNPPGCGAEFWFSIPALPEERLE